MENPSDNAPSAPADERNSSTTTLDLQHLTTVLEMAEADLARAKSENAAWGAVEVEDLEQIAFAIQSVQQILAKAGHPEEISGWALGKVVRLLADLGGLRLPSHYVEGTGPCPARPARPAVH